MGYIKKFGTLLFSIWIWSASMVVMSVSSLLGLLLALLGRPYPFVYTYALRWGLSFCPRLTFSSYKIIYDPEFDPKRTSVFAQNHVSLMDGHLACMSIKQGFCGLFNHWHFRIPGYGWIMKLSRGIAVYPRSAGRTAEITAQAKNRIHDQNIGILVFPEAHRTLDGKIRPFKKGVFFMARDAEAPIVPIAVRGMYDVNRKGSSMFHRGKVEIYVGKQIETVGVTDEQIPELSDQVRDIIVDWVEHGKLPERAIKAKADKATEEKAAA